MKYLMSDIDQNKKSIFHILSVALLCLICVCAGIIPTSAATFDRSKETPVIENTPDNLFRISKVDADSGNGIAGVTFGFYPSNRSNSLEFQTNEKGIANIYGLADGVTYTIRETSVPSPYVLNTSATWTAVYSKNDQTITITDAAKNATTYDVTSADVNKTLTIKNTAFPTLTKVDGLSGDALSGAKFALLSNTEYAEYVLSGDLPDANDSFEVTITTDPKTLTTWTLDKYTMVPSITFQSGEYDGDGTYTKGKTAELTWKAYEGHSIQKIWIDGKDQTSKYPDGITFENISSDHIVRILFDDAAIPNANYSSDAETIKKNTGTGYITGTSNSSGVIEWDGTPSFSEGSWYLIETKAPSGYDAASFTAKQIVLSGGEDGAMDITAVNTDGSGSSSTTLKNVKGKDFELYKVDGDGTPLEGAEFTLSGTSAAGDSIEITENSSTLYDDFSEDEEGNTNTVLKESGVVSFKNVPEGYNYRLTETKAPDGYLDKDGNLRQESYLAGESYYVQVITEDNTRVRNPVTLTYAKLNAGVYIYDSSGNLRSRNSDGRVEIENEKTVAFGIRKISANGNALLNGATFTLSGTSDAGNTVSKTGVTGEITSQPGFVRFDELPDGTYTVTETAAPDGFEKSAEKWIVKVSGEKVTSVKTSSGNTVETSDLYNIGVETMTVSNYPLSRFGIYKENEDGDKLSGAKFTLSGTSDGGESVLKTVTTDSSGFAEFTDLPKGTYQLTETDIPEGYGSGAYKWTVTVNPFHTVSTEAGEDVTIQTEGGVTVTEAHRGKKKITGEKRQANWKVVNSDEYYIRAGNSTYLSSGETYTGTNTGFSVTKGSTTVSPAGITWTITDSSGNLIESADAAQISLSGANLKEEKTYYVQAFFYDDAAHTSYHILQITLDYTDNAENTAAVPSDFTIVNHPGSMKLRIQKEDENDGTPLAKATFKIEPDPDGDRYTGNEARTKSITTGSDGLADFGELPDGAYKITETASPDGYNSLDTVWKVRICASDITWKADGKQVQSNNTVTVKTGLPGSEKVTYTSKEDQDTATFTVTNEKGVMLPGTGGTGVLLLIIAGILLILVYVFREMKKDRKRT